MEQAIPKSKEQVKHVLAIVVIVVVAAV